MQTYRYFVLGCLACAALSGSRTLAADYYLADGNLFPGQLFLSRDGSIEQSIHRREAVANRAYPKAATKLAQVAVAPGGKVFFTSGGKSTPSTAANTRSGAVRPPRSRPRKGRNARNYVGLSIFSRNRAPGVDPRGRRSYRG